MSAAQPRPSRRAWLRAAQARLAAVPTEDPAWEASLLLARALGVDRLCLLAAAEVELSEAERQRADDWLRRYEAGEPLAYLEGWTEFFGRRFELSPAVLVPRADSESLIELALAWAGTRPPGLLVDLGCGSGCLLLTLLAELPGWRGIGIDLSREALEVADRNRHALGLTARASLARMSWLEGMFLGPAVHLVVANPPYVVRGEAMGRGVAEYEPDLALFSPNGQPMTAYQEILSACARGKDKGGLAPQAGLLFEIGAGRGESLQKLAEGHGFRLMASRQDLGGLERAQLFQREAK